MKIYIKSMLNDDSRIDISRCEVISRVLDVIQSHPAVYHHYKVTEEIHLREDLNFDDFNCDQLQKALYFEFKLYIPGVEVFYNPTCKELINYIYQTRKERLSFEDFRNKNEIGEKFWPVPL
jgi:hypothetical protein